MTIHRATARPNASLMRSPGVSCTDQRVSLWGVLTSTVIATSAPTNSALRMMADTRRPIGILVLPSSPMGGDLYGTTCYHFATQLDGTGQNGAGWRQG